MKIFHLARPDSEKWGYDEAIEFIIISSSAKKARQLAADDPGDEGANVWTDSKESIIECIGTANKQQTEGVVVRDYRGT